MLSQDVRQRHPHTIIRSIELGSAILFSGGRVKTAVKTVKFLSERIWIVTLKSSTLSKLDHILINLVRYLY